MRVILRIHFRSNPIITAKRFLTVFTFIYNVVFIYSTVFYYSVLFAPLTPYSLFLRLLCYLRLLFATFTVFLFTAFYARLARFERATYGFVVRRSFQLSYRRLLTIYIRIKDLSIDLFERIPELLTLNWILLNPISSPYYTLRLHIAH